MLLNDRQVFNWARSGGITPFPHQLDADTDTYIEFLREYDQINPASIDLTLSPKLLIVESNLPNSEFREDVAIVVIETEGENAILEYKEIEIPENGFFLLEPGTFVLGSSNEYLKLTNEMAGFLTLKSSSARRGIGHVLASFFDPGFEGNATFELFSHIPTVLRPNMRICQMIFWEVRKSIRSYQDTGKYQGQTGPTPAR